jgi:hypothetical protein
VEIYSEAKTIGLKVFIFSPFGAVDLNTGTALKPIAVIVSQFAREKQPAD